MDGPFVIQMTHCDSLIMTALSSSLNDQCSLWNVENLPTLVEPNSSKASSYARRMTFSFGFTCNNNASCTLKTI